MISRIKAFAKQLITDNGKGMIRVNNVSYNGNSISIRDNKIFIDGVDVTPDAKQINIDVTGNIDKLNADNCHKITVGGSAGSIETMSGNVDIAGDVAGSIETMSGDVKCGAIGGSVKTMSGDIKHR